MRQSSEDRALYYRQLRQTLRMLLAPELTSAQAIDAVGLLDRILAEFIVEEEAAQSVSAEYGAELTAILRPGTAGAVPSPADFAALRAEAAEAVGRPETSREQKSQLVDVEHRFLERVDELRRAVMMEGSEPVGVSPEGCSVTNEQFTAYLRATLRDSPDVAAESMTVIPGGRSKETILVTLCGTTELPSRVILRKDRPVSVMQTRAADEFALIKAVHDFGGVPVPEPFLAEWEGHGLGEGTFEVMECVAGEKAGEFFPDLAAPKAHGVKIGEQLARTLARLHSLPLDRLAGTGLEASPVTAASLLAAVDAMVGRIHELSGPPWAAVELARRWLVDHVSLVAPSSKLTLLQGDFGFHNMLLDGPRLTALVDWEAAAIGPPARELAAAWSPVTALMPWTDFVETYRQAGGPVEATDMGAISFYRLFAALGGLMTSRLGGHLFRTGAKRDLLTAHSGLDSQFRCARNLNRALSDAVASVP